MSYEIKLLFTVLVVVGLMQLQTLVVAEPQVPCYFIFRDALVDSGNNNKLVTAGKANYLPYGIDFPQGVTGRFTNGRTIADIIGQFLGFPNFIPPYALATDQQISTGVNYGSAYAGIRQETGRTEGERVTFDMQLQNHEAVISRLSRLQQNNTFTQDYLKTCIYLVNIGSDDYINNYLMPNNYPTSHIYTTGQYAAVLTQQYSQQLTKDCRVWFGFDRCAPTEITRFSTDGKTCVESINSAVGLFNDRLKPVVDMLNSEVLPNVACCQVRAFDGQCIPNSVPCPVRALSLWYDGFHPTETVNTIFATRSYSALSAMDASPYDISHLARL
ncbi:Lipase, GDSL [Artemisia annua]|uniref:Lipase, GDSL n=1 Tax=Artemisia annua TaxID=35608 RepID=A0A2U1NZZ8_ARTAN|nr:Lipase, GDSL [Artemisia annua]